MIRKVGTEDKLNGRRERKDGSTFYWLRSEKVILLADDGRVEGLDVIDIMTQILEYQFPRCLWEFGVKGLGIVTFATTNVDEEDSIRVVLFCTVQENIIDRIEVIPVLSGRSGVAHEGVKLVHQGRLGFDPIEETQFGFSRGLERTGLLIDVLVTCRLKVGWHVSQGYGCNDRPGTWY